jgi:general nucleoside transport system permease protein
MRLPSAALATIRAAVVALLALSLSLLLIALTGKPAGESATALWQGAFGSPRQTGSTLNAVLPLTLLAVAWCVAFRAQRINVGLEGQALIGGSVAAVVGIRSGLPGGASLIAASLAGAAGGAAWAGIAAYLWACRGVNDIISTLMLNLIAVQVVAWLVRGPMQDPASTFAQSEPIPSGARWPVLWGGTTMTWAVLLIAVSAAAVAWLLAHTTFGFSLRVVGANASAARATGVGGTATGVKALVLSGAIAGFAGSCILLAGESRVLADNFAGGTGFEAIAVALLAGNAALGVPLAALLFAALQQGGGLMEARVGVPSALVLVTQGLVIALVAVAPALWLPRRRAARRGATAPPPVTSAPTDLTEVKV